MKRFISTLLLFVLSVAFSVSVAGSRSEKSVEASKIKTENCFYELNIIVPVAVTFEAPSFENYIPEKIGKVINKPMSQLLGKEDFRFKSRCTYFSC